MSAAGDTTAMVPRAEGGEAAVARAPGPSFAQGFEGMATEPFPDEARKVLAEAVDPAAVEIRPDGIVYVPGVYYRRQLTRAFGAGGWAIAPRQPARVMGDLVVYPGALYALGRFVAEAVGECKYRQNSNMSYASCVEGAKTDALSRCCKDLGMASELWDAGWRDQWKADYAESYRDDKGATKWRLRSGRPVQEIDLMRGAGGVAPPAAPKEAATDADTATSGAASIVTTRSTTSRTPSATSTESAPAHGDTGEAAAPLQLSAIRAQVKRLTWKPGFARTWLRVTFGVNSPDALTRQQADDVYLLLTSQGTPLFDKLHADLLKAGRIAA